MKNFLDLKFIHGTNLQMVHIPDDQDYGQQPCDFCGDTVCLEDETAWADCQKCDKRMCGNCRDKVYESCHVCQEKLHSGGKEPDDNNDDSGVGCHNIIICCCEGCMGYCQKCNLQFHHGGTCQVEHEKTCTEHGRAERKLALAQKIIQQKKSHLQDVKCVEQVVKREVEELENDILVAQREKIKMKKKLRTLE